MVSLAELKREKEKLLNERKAREEMLRIQREREKLQKEIRELKSPRATAFKKQLGKSLYNLGDAIDKKIKQVAEAQRKQEMKERQARARYYAKKKAMRKKR